MAGNERQGRRGNVMVIGLMFGVMLGFSALSVDIGFIRLADTQLQASLDGAALSGSAEFDGTVAGIASAIARTKAVADMNRVLDTNLNLPVGAIEVGTFNKSTGIYTAYTGGSANLVNAVRIDYTPPAIGSVLGQVAFGVAGYNINARAMAVRPRGTATTSDCFLPFAVPKCIVEEAMSITTNPKPLWFFTSTDKTDSVAFATFNGNANNNDVLAMLQGQCDGELAVGDPVYSTNGELANLFTYAAQALNNQIPGFTPTPWNAAMYGIMPLRLGRDAADINPLGGANLPAFSPNGFLSGPSSVTALHWGNTMQGPIAVVNGGISESGDCQDTKFSSNEDFDVDSIAWGILFDVRASNAGADQRNFVVQLDIENQHETTGEVDEGNMDGPVLAFGESYQLNW